MKKTVFLTFALLMIMSAPAMAATDNLQVVIGQESPALQGIWCLCEIDSYENDSLTGAMTVQKDYIEFRADGVCVMLTSKMEKEYSYDPESGELVFGLRHARVVRLTADELVWEESSGATILRYCLRRKEV